MRGDYGNGKFNNYCKNVVCEIDSAVNNNESWTSATGRIYNGTELIKYQDELDKISQRLSNKGFVDRAPKNMNPPITKKTTNMILFGLPFGYIGMTQRAVTKAIVSNI